MTSRRSLLAGVLAGGGALVTGTTVAGCSRGRSPTPSPGATTSRPGRSAGPTPAPGPTPDATATRFAAVERRLLARTEAVLGRGDAGTLAAPRARLLRAVRDGHRQHLAALTSPEPTSRPLPSGTPSSPGAGAKGSLADALDELAAAEQAAVAGYRSSAAATVSFGSLLYASLAAATQGYATVLDDVLDGSDPPTPIGGMTRPVLAAWTELEAEQSLLAACHAMLYGYKAAVGFVSETSGTGKRMIARLSDYQQLRDRLTALVVAAHQEPVAAEPAYRLPVRVTGTASATDLARRIELAVQPHFGRAVAAATTPAVHTAVLTGLADAAGTALSWGAGVSAWPGWPR